jgi:hypothetical protein
MEKVQGYADLPAAGRLRAALQGRCRGFRRKSGGKTAALQERPCPLPLGFSQVLILKVVEVLCFDTLLQVLILNIVSLTPV